MEIKGLPKTPFPCDVIEHRKGVAGEAWLSLPKREWIMIDSGTMLEYLIAIPKPLTGTDWLDAQPPHMFLFEGEEFVIVHDSECGPACSPMVRRGSYAWGSLVPGGWKDLERCFPNGWEQLSDENCRSLCSQIGAPPSGDKPCG